MFLIRKDFVMDAGHRLTKHHGKCWNLHGHRYTIEVHLCCEDGALDELGMVLDFYHLAWFKEWLDKNWDHGLILFKDDVDLIEFCKKHGHKLFILPVEPTAENMAKAVFGIVLAELNKMGKGEVHKIVVHETPTCSATYIP